MCDFWNKCTYYVEYGEQFISIHLDHVTGKLPLEIYKFQTRDFVNRVSVRYIAQ